MTDVVLATMNARWQHAAFGLRCLRANLGAHRESSILVEGTIDDRPLRFAERILAESPRVVGLSVYIWNVVLLTEVAAIIKRVSPDILLVVGGPEVSHELDKTAITSIADVVVTGEGETAFVKIVDDALNGVAPNKHVVSGGLPDLTVLKSPYGEYTDEDLKDRVLYVESSRGCPFTCAFCLSALDARVRRFPTDAFLDDLATLKARGATTFKFVDRTFNIHVPTAVAILDRFLEWQHDDVFAHFEVIPDRLPDPLKERLKKFKPGALQLEVGIQTLNPDTAKAITRAAEKAKIEENLRYLREETEAHLHVDLIAGLPGEDMASFGRGFDWLHALNPHEIQLGILKRLKGTPLTHIEAAHGLVFTPEPPYEVLKTTALSFAALSELRRIARVHDLVMNSGRFTTTSAMLLDGPSPFASLRAFVAWITERQDAFFGIALARLTEFVFQYLVDEKGVDADLVARALLADYTGRGERRVPPFILKDTRVSDDVKQHFSRLGARRRDGEAHEQRAKTQRQRRHKEGDAASTDVDDGPAQKASAIEASVP